jgi:hypothetical protein
MVKQVSTYVGQENGLNQDTTLYTVFFGINDYSASIKDNVANLPAAAAQVLNQTEYLISTQGAQNFLFIGTMVASS